MNPRLALLLTILWACTVVWAYRFGTSNTENATEAAKVPALVQVIQEHDRKEVAGHEADAKATKALAKTDERFDKLNNEVLNYAQNHTGAVSCELDARGLRIWTEANANADPDGEAKEDRAGEPDRGLPGAARTAERQAARPAEQPRSGSKAVPQVPGAASRPGRLDGEEPMTDIVDAAVQSEEEARDRALQEQSRRAGLADKTVEDSAVECVVCEFAIPLARREAVPGVQTCIDCQTELEGAMRVHTRGYQ